MSNFALRIMVSNIQYHLDELRKNLDAALEDGTDQQNIDWLTKNIEIRKEHLKQAQDMLIVHSHEEN